MYGYSRFFLKIISKPEGLETYHIFIGRSNSHWPGQVLAKGVVVANCLEDKAYVPAKRGSDNDPLGD